MSRSLAQPPFNAQLVKADNAIMDRFQFSSPLLESLPVGGFQVHSRQKLLPRSFLNDTVAPTKFVIANPSGAGFDSVAQAERKRDPSRGTNAHVAKEKAVPSRDGKSRKGGKHKRGPSLRLTLPFHPASAPVGQELKRAREQVNSVWYLRPPAQSK
ncbi:UNVERIFIED_CONTAM: hypothetical protein K2H54_003642 [Gekko kuhli]